MNINEHKWTNLIAINWFIHYLVPLTAPLPCGQSEVPNALAPQGSGAWSVMGAFAGAAQRDIIIQGSTRNITRSRPSRNRSWVSADGSWWAKKLNVFVLSTRDHPQQDFQLAGLVCGGVVCLIVLWLRSIIDKVFTMFMFLAISILLFASLATWFFIFICVLYSQYLLVDFPFCWFWFSFDIPPDSQRSITHGSHGTAIMADSERPTMIKRS